MASKTSGYIADPLAHLATKFEIRDDDCWEWQAYVEPGGYGRVGIRHASSQLAHRAVYELTVGPIDADLTLDHLCRNRRCVNPDHLEPVSRRENIQRGDVGAHNRAKTHCPHGHEYTADNLRTSPSGNRQCKACHREREAARRARRAD